MSSSRFLPATLAALLACALQLGCTKKSASSSAASPAGAKVQPVEVFPIKRHDLVDSLDLTGTIAPNESAQIRAEVAGIVREIFFVEGQQVKKGQVLLKIDDTELAAQTQQAEATLELARSNYNRSSELLKTASSTPAEFERASAEMKTAQAQLALLRSRLGKTEIRAPFDGTVGARAVSPGDYVTSQSTLTTVEDLSKLKIEFDVPELYIQRVRTGTPFSIDMRGSETGTALKGEIYFVSSVISRETRSSAVKGLLVSPPETIRPGMFAKVTLVLEVHRGALTVPEGAILNSTQGAQIVIVDGPETAPVAKFVPVKLGLRTEAMVEVSTPEPIEGKMVVATGVGALALTPGMKLSPRPAPLEVIQPRG